MKTDILLINFSNQGIKSVIRTLITITHRSDKDETNSQIFEKLRINVFKRPKLSLIVAKQSGKYLEGPVNSHVR